MEDRKSIEKNGFIRGSGYWTTCADFGFARITHDARLPLMWSDYKRLEVLGYKDNIFKPINPYALFFGTKPTLEIIDDNCIILKQKTHAEIWVQHVAEQLYMLDKCWQRQFYPDTVGTKLNLDKHFNAIFKFYMPWIMNMDVEVKIISYDHSPFTIFTDKVLFGKIDPEARLLDSPWIKFAMKEDSEYMTEEYGVIPIGTDMYGIMITNKNAIERIIKEYEEKA